MSSFKWVWTKPDAEGVWAYGGSDPVKPEWASAAFVAATEVERFAITQPAWYCLIIPGIPVVEFIMTRTDYLWICVEVSVEDDVKITDHVWGTEYRPFLADFSEFSDGAYTMRWVRTQQTRTVECAASWRPEDEILSPAPPAPPAAAVDPPMPSAAAFPPAGVPGLPMAPQS